MRDSWWRVSAGTLLLFSIWSGPAWAEPVSPQGAAPVTQETGYTQDVPVIARAEAPLLNLDGLAFRPKRRPDGTCCPPPPAWELRDDPCEPLDPCPPIDCCVSPWSLELGLGLNLAQGNSDSFDIAFLGALTYDRRPWKVSLAWLLAYGESNGATTTDAFHAELKAERRLQGPWTVFGAVTYDRNDIADLQYRWVPTAGVGYRFFERKGTYLKGEVGAGMTSEKRSGLSETTDPSGYAAVEYMRAFRNGIDLNARARFLPNFGDFDLSLLILEAQLAVPLGTTSALTLTTRIDHVLDAPAPADNTDVIVTAGIKIKL